MVRRGLYQIELIDAETKIAFKEHQHLDGRMYAEVEPDIDYFLNVRNHSNDMTVIFQCSVDGKELGYSQVISPGCDWEEQGLYNQQNGAGYHKSLRFNKLINQDQVGDHEYAGHWTGCVEIKVYEHVEMNEYETSIREDTASSWTPNADHILEGLNMSSKKKACNTIKGETRTAVREFGLYKKFRCGSLLSTIKLYYCTTVGLIYAKVLVEPPKGLFSFQRPSSIDRKVRDGDEQEVRRSQKRRINNGSTNGIVVETIVRTQTVDYIDLTKD